MKKAPHFSLLDQNGVRRSLHDYIGKWVLLYFYPKDDTPGCTKEACGFRDTATLYSKQNIIVVGISKDSVASHKEFAEKYHLTFTLLSDESTNIIKAYDAWGERIKRISFLINPNQMIQKEYLKIDVFTHAKEILEDVLAFSK